MNSSALQDQKGPAHTEPLELLTPEELSQILGVNVRTLAMWRYTGRHALPYIRCGASIRYERKAVNEWLEKRTQTKTKNNERAA